MSEQQQGSGFPGSKNARRFDGGGAGRPNFGGRDFSRGGGRDGGRRDGGQTQLFQATCSNCGKPCEVPFRPVGDKPVYCKECFAKRRESSPREFQKQRTMSQFSSSSQQGGGVRLDELKRQMDAMNAKLDVLLQKIGGAGGGGGVASGGAKASATPKRVAKKPRTSSKSSKK